jgi:hypothetical protein
MGKVTRVVAIAAALADQTVAAAAISAVKYAAAGYERFGNFRRSRFASDFIGGADRFFGAALFRVVIRSYFIPRVLFHEAYFIGCRQYLRYNYISQMFRPL